MRSARRVLAVAATTAIIGACAAVRTVAVAAGPVPSPACQAVQADIYSPPAILPGTPGKVIACRRVALPHVPGNIRMQAWQLQYTSTDNRNRPTAVSGTVAVPSAPWRGRGSRPIVAFNPGSLGLGSQCALSRQLAGEYQDEYEGDNIAALLRAGFAVAATDGAGYLTGTTHPYMSGADAGHALLDIARAAPEVPGVGLDERTKVGLSGYSEGGAATLWAAQLASSYAPELNVVGAAAGGVPGDLRRLAKALHGGAFAGFFVDTAVGLSTAHPQLPFDSLLSQAGRAAVVTVKTHCLVGNIVGAINGNVEDYTADRLSLDELLALRGTDGASWGQVLDQQKLGVNVGPAGSRAKYRLKFPLFQYRSVADEVIPTSVEDDVRRAYCQAGVASKWSTYPADHLIADRLAVDDVTAWFTSRFNDRPITNDCGFS